MMECKDCEVYKQRHSCKHECMLLPDGKTCSDCSNFPWCSKVYGVKADYTSCDFEPIRFREEDE